MSAFGTSRHVRFPNLKLSTTSLPLRLAQHVVERINVAANKRDGPDQSLIKVWLSERLEAK